MSLLPHFYRVPLSVPYWNGTTYRAIFRSLISGSVIAGRDLGKLRSAVMERLGVEDAIICGSGSLALELALRACGVREGDEVVIPTFCCTSVVPPILAVGAHPVLADVGEELNITAETVEAVLTNKTKAIIVPHLFGNPADIDAIVDLARPRNIRVIDDAAQALGATIDGRPVGSFGNAGILSFGSEKVCFGLGGGVIVSRQEKHLNARFKDGIATGAAVSYAADFSFDSCLATLAALDAPGASVVISCRCRQSRFAAGSISKRNHGEP